MKTFTFIIALSIGASTIFAQETEKKVNLSGKIPMATGQKIYINTFKNNQMAALDSAIIDKKGKYSLNFSIPVAKEFYSISLSPNNYALLIMDAKNTGSKLVFNADSSIITKDYTIEGSAESKDVLEFTTLVNKFQGKLAALKEGYDHPDSVQVAQVKQQQLYDEFITNRNQFVDNHLNSLALLITTSYFNPQGELEWFKKIEQALGKTVPNSNYHLAVKGQLQQIEAAAQAENQQNVPQQDVNIGKQVTELNFIDPSGKVLTLEALKGQYVLVDFWASWCKPCRMENPNVVNLYNKYKDAGFTVYSVSLDTDKNRWVEAIAQDQLSWPYHVSDLKGWKTEATSIYQFRGIPYTMLVDKEGKIVATKLRGPQLESELKAIFGF